nr:unnamed protein product [Spirometra erinaceieuropaei]
MPSQTHTPLPSASNAPHVTMPGTDSDTANISYESVAQRVVNQCLEQQPTLDTSVPTPLTATAHSDTVWAYQFKCASTNTCDNPRSNQPERRKALVARELARYKVDIVALSQTRFSDQGQLKEVGAGYTFFGSGRPRPERRDAERHRETTAQFAAGHQRSPDEPPSASPGWGQIRHHHQHLRSADDQPRRRQRQIIRGPARPLGDCVEGGQVDCPW